MTRRMFRPTFVSFFCCIAFVPITTGQTIWYVDAAHCPGPGSGTPADPFCTIQIAINAAAPSATPPDEIVVADGVYSGAGNKNLDFHGKAITVRSASGDPATCIIDCENEGRGFYFHSNETAASIVMGLTIRYGRMTPYTPGSLGGGGVCCESSSPTISHCIISHSGAGTRLGGGVFCISGSSPTLTGCSIEMNDAACGGGVYCTNLSAPTLTDCTINGNTAISGITCTGGGGICCVSSSSATLTNCTINENNGLCGGGVSCE
ncbi:MAG TPA: right-handed parallel beta-helix repeat-containing protein [Phycisphaerae bacterium]|nr:right-handed parallel beta-helix repeat-containing protein [Phycisphaerae bacterium]